MTKVVDRSSVLHNLKTRTKLLASFGLVSFVIIGDGDHRCGDAPEVERSVTSGVRRLYGPIGRVR